MKEHNLVRETAELVMDSALGFLKLCADHPRKAFVPSRLVDIGWHEFLMYTRDYQEFCERIAGRFIHHEPSDDPMKSRVSNAARTVSFMKQHDVSFHRDAWLKSGSEDCDS